jgi:hypothetical protein
MRDLVVHGAAVLRVWMTNHGRSDLKTIPRRIDNGFEPANRSIDEQFFGNGRCSHRFSLFLSIGATLTCVP